MTKNNLKPCNFLGNPIKTNTSLAMFSLVIRLKLLNPRRLAQAFLTFVLLASSSAIAADDKTKCEECAPESEFSWNPNSQSTPERLRRFYDLDDQITAAFKENNFDKVKELAKENLELAAVYRCNWNYGNAIHDTNRILGLVSLKTGDTDAAVDYLLKAGKSTGSPQLDTFGPELDLANELLKMGKTEAVKTYLTDIKSFWEMDRGKIDQWLTQIEQGKKPELDRFEANKPGLLLIIYIWLFQLWPFVAAALFLIFKRKKIQKKVLFFIVAVMVGYAAMLTGYWVIGKALRWALLGLDSPSEAMIYLVSYLPTAVLFLIPVAAIFVLERFVNPKDATSKTDNHETNGV